MNNLFVRGVINSGIAALYFFNYMLEMYKTEHEVMATIALLAFIMSILDVVAFYAAPALVLKEPSAKKDTNEEG